MIKYIVETISSETNTNSNREHFARITSTKTGHSLVLDSVGGGSSAAARVRELLNLNWSEIWRIQHHKCIRDWRDIRRVAVNEGFMYEHELTATNLRRLNRRRQ